MKTIKLVTLGVKIGIIVSNRYQDSENLRGKLEVKSSNFKRNFKAKIEARDALRARDVNSLSSMSPRSRGALRQMALDELLKAQARLTDLREVAGELKAWDVGPEITRIETYENFLLEAVNGELVLGEEGRERPIVPSSRREAANKPSLGK